MEITFQIDDNFIDELNLEPLQAALETTLRQFGPQFQAEPTLTLTVTDNATIQQLNAEYLNIDAPTDVLSFQNIPDPDFPEVDPTALSYLGDVIIAYPVAKSQAEARGHSLMDEITLLAIHGTLHLLGFDHERPEDKERMWAAQQGILAELGLSHVQPTED